MSTDGTGRQSPLSAFFATAADDPADGAAVVITERPFLGHLNLRGDPGDGRFTSAAAGVLGFALPTKPNTTVGEGGLLALWLGPDEWLVVTPPDVTDLGSRSRSRAALQGVHASVTDVTGGQTVLTLSGPNARYVLAKGLPARSPPRGLRARRLRADAARQGQRHHALRRRLAVLRAHRPPQLRRVRRALAPRRRAGVRRGRSPATVGE